MADYDLDLAELRRCLAYNPCTGIFTRKVASGNARVGAIAGSVYSRGYRVVSIKNRKIQAHRLAWFYVYGVWPSEQLDHIDRSEDANSVFNLRECTVGQNAQNRGRLARNKSGYIGVSWHKNSQRWRADICVAQRRITLGHFKTKEAAAEAYAKAKAELHPFHPMVIRE